MSPSTNRLGGRTGSLERDIRAVRSRVGDIAAVGRCGQIVVLMLR